MQHDQYLTVTALTKYISKKFTYDPYLDKVYLIGEISNFRLRPRHQYFSLKDKNAKIEAVMFQSNFKRIKFQPEEGMKVLVTGKIEVYEQTGKYQINIETMQPDGVGALYKAYEQLKEKLTQEGLFSKPKRELAKFPKRIAVITSPSGAVIRDIITTTRRRYPIVQLVLFPAEVQGGYAKDSLVKRLKEVNKLANFDTIIIGRGGGSIEDLWPFNEEEVARAIANSKIPVISSVGHETDTTLADLAADVRAATPTAAAELATPVLSEVLVKLKDSQVRLAGSMQRIIKNKSNQLTKLKNSFIFTQPERLYDGYVQRLDLAETRLINKIETIFHQNQNRLLMEKNKLEHVSPINRIEKLNVLLDSSKKQLVTLTNNIIKEKISEFKKKEKALELLDPSQIMDRGYSYVTAIKNDAVIKNVDDLSDNEELNLHFKDGVAQVKVLRIRRD